MDPKKLLEAILEQSYLHRYPDIHINTDKRPYFRDNTWSLNILEKITIDTIETETPLLSKDMIKYKKVSCNSRNGWKL